jgi:hypothetical protein
MVNTIMVSAWQPCPNVDIDGNCLSPGSSGHRYCPPGSTDKCMMRHPIPFRMEGYRGFGHIRNDHTTYLTQTAHYFCTVMLENLSCVSVHLYDPRFNIRQVDFGGLAYHVTYQGLLAAPKIIELAKTYATEQFAVGKFIKLTLLNEGHNNISCNYYLIETEE